MYCKNIVIRVTFSIDPQQCTKHKVETADQVSRKFVGLVYVIFQTGSCRIIQSYSPGGDNNSRKGESRWA